MSGVFKTIGKVFRTVGKFVKKIAAPALAIGAIVFTAGAALGLAPMATGFGGAVSSALGAIGAPTTGVIGSALTGAITQAGYGAAIGGVGSLVTGGDFSKGASLGALAGAVTGGIGGALNPTAGPLAGPASMSSRSMPPGMEAPPMPRPAPVSGVAQQVAEGPATAGGAVTGPATNGGAGIISGVTRGLGTLLDKPGFGTAIAGLGQGLLTGLAAQDQQQEDHYGDIQESYDVNGNVYDSSANASVSGWTPRRYIYNPKSRRIEMS